MVLYLPVIICITVKHIFGEIIFHFSIFNACCKLAFWIANWLCNSIHKIKISLPVIGNICNPNLILFFIPVRALQAVKGALGLPLRFGWNGDPCVPQQHPWSGAECQLDRASSKWIIDGLYFPDPVSRFHFISFASN